MLLKLDWERAEPQLMFEYDVALALRNEFCEKALPQLMLE